MIEDWNAFAAFTHAHPLFASIFVLWLLSQPPFKNWAEVIGELLLYWAIYLLALPFAMIVAWKERKR